MFLSVCKGAVALATDGEQTPGVLAEVSRVRLDKFSRTSFRFVTLVLLRVLVFPVREKL